jgi:hypothetical protein
MRPKPPADRPNINPGKPWSAFDMDELEELLEHRRSVADIADFLCRDVDEVEAKIASIRN